MCIELFRYSVQSQANEEEVSEYGIFESSCFGDFASILESRQFSKLCKYFLYCIMVGKNTPSCIRYNIEIGLKEQCPSVAVLLTV